MRLQEHDTKSTFHSGETSSSETALALALDLPCGTCSPVE